MHLMSNAESTLELMLIKNYRTLKKNEIQSVPELENSFLLL